MAATNASLLERHCAERPPLVLKVLGLKHSLYAGFFNNSLITPQ